MGYLTMKVMVGISTSIFCLWIIFSQLFAHPEHSSGMFHSSVADLYFRYNLSISPTPYTAELFWTFMQFWFAAAHLFMLWMLFHHNAVGVTISSPEVLSPLTLTMYSLCLLGFTAWGFVWDRLHLQIAALLLSAIAGMCCLLLLWIHRSVYVHGQWMSLHTRITLWLYRLLWLNGVTALAAWAAYTAIFQFGIALRYEHRMEMHLVMHIVLGGISGLAILGFILENTLLDSYMRYSLASEAVFVYLVTGMYYHANDMQVTDDTWYLIVAVHGLSVFLLVSRFGFFLLKCFTEPLYKAEKVLYR